MVVDFSTAESRLSLDLNSPVSLCRAKCELSPGETGRKFCPALAECLKRAKWAKPIPNGLGEIQMANVTVIGCDSDHTQQTFATMNGVVPSTGKRKAAGRPPDEQIWKHFKQIQLPSEKAKTIKRNHDAECNQCGRVIVGKPYKMKEHLSLCDDASNSDRMEADTMQISAAASTSSHPASGISGKAVNRPTKITKFMDEAKLTASANRLLSVMLCIAFVTAGWSFRTVENAEFQAFIQNLRPNYVLPSESYKTICLAAGIWSD